MPAYFVFNNLKVNPFVLGDNPLPGFDLVAWDAWTVGTLLDIGEDAGFSRLGKTEIHGQLWKLSDPREVYTLEEYVGKLSGLVDEIKIPVIVSIDEYLTEKLTATTFSIARIKPEYKILHTGRWRF